MPFASIFESQRIGAPRADLRHAARMHDAHRDALLLRREMRERRLGADDGE
jgi:hypothetical protein